MIPIPDENVLLNDKLSLIVYPDFESVNKIAKNINAFIEKNFAIVWI